MSVKSPSAPTCPGTHDPTSPQSFLMTFTKFSKSPKRPKISDNILGRTCCSFHHLFFFFWVTAVAAFSLFTYSNHQHFHFFAELWCPGLHAPKQFATSLCTHSVCDLNKLCSPLCANHAYCCIFVTQRRSRCAPVGVQMKRWCRTFSFGVIGSVLSPSKRCCSHISIVFLLYRINFLALKKYILSGGTNRWCPHTVKQYPLQTWQKLTSSIVMHSVDLGKDFSVVHFIIYLCRCF